MHKNREYICNNIWKQLMNKNKNKSLKEKEPENFKNLESRNCLLSFSLFFF